MASSRLRDQLPDGSRRLVLVAAQHQGGVRAAEAERVAHRVLEASLACLVRHVVEAALRVWIRQVDRWRDGSGLDRLGANRRLDRASSEYDGEGKEIRKVDTIEDQDAVAPTTNLEKRELVELSTRGLSRKEKLIVILYYLEELTMKEIGLVLDLSESRVCQIHHRILYRLKESLERLRDDLLG